MSLALSGDGASAFVALLVVLSAMMLFARRRSPAGEHRVHGKRDDEEGPSCESHVMSTR
jgi:hypothetical protein